MKDWFNAVVLAVAFGVFIYVVTSTLVYLFVLVVG